MKSWIFVFFARKNRLTPHNPKHTKFLRFFKIWWEWLWSTFVKEAIQLNDEGLNIDQKYANSWIFLSSNNENSLQLNMTIYEHSGRASNFHIFLVTPISWFTICYITSWSICQILIPPLVTKLLLINLDNYIYTYYS